MKKFCRYTLLFSIPIFLGIILLHIYVSYNPSMFRNKANYVQTHKNEIEVLFLGSSHTQEAINPLRMENSVANLAYNAQNVVANCMLFDKYVEELPNLKFLVFEFDYFTLEDLLTRSSDGVPLFRKFHNLPNTSFFANFSSKFGDIPFLRTYVYECWKFKLTDYHVNEAGYVTKSKHDPFGDMHHDATRIFDTAPERLKTRHKARGIENIEQNSTLIESMIAKAKTKGIQVIFLALPKYQTYLDREIPDKLKRRNAYVNKKVKDKDVIFLDYERDPRYKSVDLYLDDNHLGKEGAVIFTAMMDSVFTSLR